MEMRSLENGWELPVGGQMVTRCCIDNEMIILLCQNSVEVAIGEPFLLISPGGHRQWLDPSPSRDPVRLSPLLQVMRQVIEAGVAFHDGHLELSFQNAMRINVPPGIEYEAWTLAGPGGLKMVSAPGGEVVIWSAD